MAFTLVGYSEAQNTTTLANMAALADPHVRVSGDDIVVPELSNLIGAYTLGSSTTQARLSAPSLRTLIEPDLEPIDTGSNPTSPIYIHDFIKRPLELDRGEALNYQVAQNSGTFRSYGLVWLADNHSLDIPAGKIFTVRATSNTTLTANTWTNGALTFAQTLPAGRYVIVGMRAQSSNLIAARLVIPGHSWRPGVVGVSSDSELDYRGFRYGNLGVFGEFAHNEPPTVDFLASAADTSEVVHLDLIKIE